MNQLQINHNKDYKPNFASNWRTVKDEFGKVRYKNNTEFFRIDLNWNKFTDMLIEKYKHTDKVNIYNYACSEGAEPFSLAMLLIKKLGKEKAQKFFPIIASDIDEEILKNPKQGIIKVSSGDIFLIKRKLGNDYSKFIDLDNKFKYSSKFKDILCNGKITPILEDTIVFDTKDITKDFVNIKKDNSIVFCRNFWPYLSKNDQLSLSANLSERLGNNSLCVIGSYDKRKLNMIKTFKSQGFNRTANTFLCYEK